MSPNNTRPAGVDAAITNLQEAIEIAKAGGYGMFTEVGILIAYITELEARPTRSMDAGNGEWFDFQAPQEHANPQPDGISESSLPDFRTIWRVAREHGYSIGLHGSMRRDCDLIAVPWVEKHSTPDDLIVALCAALNASEIGGREEKPVGRIAVNLAIDGWYRLIDLSIATYKPAQPVQSGNADVSAESVEALVREIELDCYHPGAEEIGVFTSFDDKECISLITTFLAKREGK